MDRGHIVISGTGRAGTTFLVQLLTQCGLDTGFDRETMAANFYPTARAGLEISRSLGPNAPTIVKSPFLCDDAEGLLASGARIQHVIIPVRRFAAAAASREYVQRLVTGHSDGSEAVPGGLWDTDKADAQVEVLRLKFTKLIETLVRHDIPMTFLSYPRLVRDPDYLHRKLNFLLSSANVDFDTFKTVFDKVVRPEWTHQFTADDI
jgi:hypothetical protein